MLKKIYFVILQTDKNSSQHFQMKFDTELFLIFSRDIDFFAVRKCRAERRNQIPIQLFLIPEFSHYLINYLEWKF